MQGNAAFIFPSSNSLITNFPRLCLSNNLMLQGPAMPRVRGLMPKTRPAVFDDFHCNSKLVVRWQLCVIRVAKTPLFRLPPTGFDIESNLEIIRAPSRFDESRTLLATSAWDGHGDRHCFRLRFGLLQIR